MGKKKKSKSWSERFDAETAAAVKTLGENVIAERFKAVPENVQMIGLAAQIAPTEDQIKVMCLQRELHLAKAEVLELKLREMGVEF
jgi:hypothetical protein